jgi:hypothetical protein
MPMLAAFGATVGAGLDYLHTDGGAIVYPDDMNHWRGILTFLVVYPVAGLLFTMWVRSAGLTKRPAPYSRLWPSVGVYVLLYTMTAYAGAHIHSYVQAAILFAAGAVFWHRFDGSWQGFVGGVGAGVIGAGTEAALSHWGTMQYTTQDALMVPVWLPAIYWCSSFSWGQVCRRALLIDDHHAAK